jgi:hypothetical protein
MARGIRQCAGTLRATRLWAVNRVALHQSTVHPMSPVDLVEIARRAGLDAIGLRVAATAEAQEWWSHGIGSPMLPALVDALLASRVTVLDIGRVELGPELRSVDFAHPYVRVLELGTRLGAQFVTARAGTGDPAELFPLLAELASRYRLRPLLTVVPGTPIDSVERALDLVGGTSGGIVLDVDPRRDPAELEESVVELGDRLGYVRILASALEDLPEATPGLLATLPPHIPIALGADEPGHLDSDQVARATALRRTVDAMLRHPRAGATV